MDTRTRVMLIGGLLGGVIGVAAARLYLRAAERRAGEGEETELPSLEPGDMIKLTLSVLGVLRLVDGLTKPGKQEG